MLRVPAFQVRSLGQCNPQDLSNLLWAYASLGYHPGETVLGAISEEVVAKVGGFNAQGVANTVWAYAALGYDPGEGVLGALTEHAGQIQETFVAGEWGLQQVFQTSLVFDGRMYPSQVSVGSGHNGEVV